jgi:hypothetical protein
MNTIAYSVIEPIARRIRQARLKREPVQLNADQATLLDEWMQCELELQADSEWLARAVAADDPADFISLENVEAKLAVLEAERDELSG